MKLSDRYLFGELILPFLITTLAVVMMLVGNTLFAILPDMVQKHWPVVAVLRICVLNIPAVLYLAIPVGTAFAASLAINRVARDNEITVLRSAGVPLFRAFMPVVLFGVLTSAADLYIADRVVPWAYREQQNVETMLNLLPNNPVDVGLTVRVENYTITFQSAQKITPSKRRLTQLVIVENPKPGTGDYATITTAKTADYENGLWTMHEVVTHHYDKTGLTDVEFRSEPAYLNQSIDFSSAYSNNGGASFGNVVPFTFEEMTQKAREARRFGNFKDAVSFETERWFHLSLPLMSFTFALLGPPLALRFSRAGAFTGVLLSIVAVFVAWNTLLLLKIISLGNWVPPVVCAWTTNVIFTLIAVWLIKAQD